METYDAIVIGGGQAGLASGYHLQQLGSRFLILEGGDNAVGSWKHYYDSLKLFSPARYSSLPQMPFPGDPNRYPTRDEVVNYLRCYAEHFRLPIQTNAFVDNVTREDSSFYVFTSSGGTYRAQSIIAATGAFSRPHMPQFDGQEIYSGAILHSSAYRNPAPFVNQRILVIGAGNSAVQIAVELANTAQVTLTSREPVRFRRQRILGQDIHFWLRVSGFDTWKRKFPKWTPLMTKDQGVLDTGVYQAAFRSGNPSYHPFFVRFTEHGVEWADGTQSIYDAVIFATGFRPNLPFLHSLGALDAYGNALHENGVSTVVPGLYYVGLSGQRSFASATLRGVGDDAAYVTRHLKRYLQHPARQLNQLCCFFPMPV